MCGIAGVLEREGTTRVDVDAVLRCLLHRGPDAHATFTSPGGVVGQTRLSVIDLITGDPPVANEDDSIGVAFNGEIYNFLELRKRLAEEGHAFRSEGDTETIPHLSESLEPAEVASQLEGMFAYAVSDGRRRRLVLVRDRVGKKPLYYWEGDGEIAFASEIKALLELPQVPRRLNPAAISAYLTFGYVPTPQTFFEGIRSVPPGSVLVAEAGSRSTIERYWELPRRTEGRAPSFDDAASGIRERLTAAVERRLISDVPLGAFLSGGVDSSTVVAIMSRLGSAPVRTFTIGFEDEEGFDERPYARLVAKRYGTDHTEFVVQPNAVDLIERLVWHYDQPFGDSSALPTFLLSELTRRHVTVALSGDGGDELFAGYERFAAALALERYQRVPKALRHVPEGMLFGMPARAFAGRVGSLQRFARRAELDVPRAFLSWLSYLDEDWRSRLLPGASDWAIDDYLAIWQQSEGAPLLDRLLLQNLRTYLLDDLLPKMDRMSMAHALEVRSPFLDRELTEFAFSLPAAYKVKGLSLKRVLKHAVQDLVPAEVLARRKKGFGVPLDRWFRTDLRSYLHSMLRSKESRIREHLRGEAVDRLVLQHDRGARDHGHALWALLTLEVFLRREGW